VRLRHALVAVAALAAVPAALAAESVTIKAQPTTVGANDDLTLSGTIDVRRTNERVTVQLKSCRGTVFNDVTTAFTTRQGTWLARVGFGGGPGEYRARWRARTSAAVRVQYRPAVSLLYLGGHRFQISVGALEYFSGKRALLQRQDARLGRWITIKSVVLAEGSGGRSEAEFRAVAAKGITLRAAFPRSQAKPCYLAGYSAAMRR
jgi:hypothetical protein